MGTRNNAEVSWDQVKLRCDALKARNVGDKKIQDIDFIESIYVGKLSAQYFANMPVNTLDNALLEIKAGLHRATLDPRLPSGKVGKESYLQGENWRDFSSRVSELTDH